MNDKNIDKFISEIKNDLMEYEYRDTFTTEDMSWKIFELLQTREIQCRIVAYPLIQYDKDNQPEYEFQLDKYPKVDLIYDYNNINEKEKAIIASIEDNEDFNFIIDDDYIFYIDSENKKDLLRNFTIENGHLMYELGILKGLHWSILIKYSSGWKDFDYSEMDIFYHPIYAKSKMEKYIIQEYDPNSIEVKSNLLIPRPNLVLFDGSFVKKDVQWVTDDKNISVTMYPLDNSSKKLCTRTWQNECPICKEKSTLTGAGITIIKTERDGKIITINHSGGCIVCNFCGSIMDGI